jgi:hypothetical protein
MARTRARALPRNPPTARPTAVPEPSAPPTRGVTVMLDLPDASAADVLAVADTLHSLALDLVPGASARTDVHLTEPAADRAPNESQVRHR